ncbi:hypothetical protein IWX76_001577 [Pedobacter sp. CAN_A7]
MEQDQIIIYQTSNGETRIDVKLEGETLWWSLKLMSQLFDKDSDTIGLHIKNIYRGGIGRGFNYQVFLGSHRLLLYVGYSR